MADEPLNQSVPAMQAADDADTRQTKTGNDAPDTRFPAGEQTGSAAPVDAVPGYWILGELGRGGMGVVYKARQISLNRLVALKMILAGSHARPDSSARFLREAEVIARLKHPHVVQVYDFGSHAGKPYLALEYLEGGSLADQLQGQPRPPTQAAQLVETLAHAVQAAHEKGIVHRDLKPANVLLAADGTPKITDFGLAKQADSGMTATGEVLGTPSYMAPEQAEGKPSAVGPAADVYALGAILYELLTGRPPFKGATAWDTLLMVVASEPVPPTQLQPKVPRDLETICLKCLQKEPAKRYRSCPALADDLRRFLNQEPITARPVGTWERAHKWARRRPAVAGLLALVTAVTVLGLALVLWQWRAAVVARDAANIARQDAEDQQKQTQAALAAEARRRQQARDALDAMSSQLVEDWLLRQEELLPEQKQFLRKALQSYEEFAQETAADPQSRAGVARAYWAVGRIRQSLGQLKDATQAYQRSRELYRQLVAELPDRVEPRQALANCHYTLAHLLGQTRRIKEAEAVIREGIAIWEKLAAEDPQSQAFRENLVISQNVLADIFKKTRRFSEAETTLRQMLMFQKQFVRDFPNRTEPCWRLANYHHALALLYHVMERWKEAEAESRASVAVLKPIVEKAPARASYRSTLAQAYGEQGTALKNLDRFQEAEEAQRTAIRLLKQLANDFPSKPDYHFKLAIALSDLAGACETRDPQTARQLLEEALVYIKAALQVAPTNVDYLSHYYSSHYGLGHTLLALQDHAGAQAAIEIYETGCHIPDAAYDCAVAYCTCARLAQNDSNLPASKRQALVKGYADQAMTALQRACQMGYADLHQLKTDKEIDPVRGRADFRRLLAGLEKPSVPKK